MPTILLVCNIKPNMDSSLKKHGIMTIKEEMSDGFEMTTKNFYFHWPFEFHLAKLSMLE
jgi:hypothetical protein